MPLPLRRVRGLVLRLVRRRVVAVLVGAALLVPAVWVQLRGSYAPWIDGVALVAGATGAALIWAAWSGPRPDWVDRSGPS
jgi:hypothetical protein